LKTIFFVVLNLGCLPHKCRNCLGEYLPSCEQHLCLRRIQNKRNWKRGRLRSNDGVYAN